MHRFITLSLCLLAALSGARPLTAQSSGEVLHNGIAMPAVWPPQTLPTQAYRVPSYLTNPPAVLPVNVGRQLFVDDFLIENTTLTRTQHRPTMFAGNPIMRTSLNGERAMPFSDGVWFDPADRVFKMWYWGPSVAPYLCYAYSYDGKNWIKPSLPNGAVKDTNIVINFGGGRDSGTVWMDLEDLNPAKKFKGFFYGGGGFLRVFFSPDGIVWTEQPFKISSLSDRTTLFWNPVRKVWGESARSGAVLPATSTRPAISARSRYYLESKDLQNWLPGSSTTYAFWTSADEKDPAYPGTSTLPQLYNLDAVAYESVFVGLFNMYYAEPAPLLVELNAGFSRDGYQWVRPTRGAADKAFIPSTNRDGDWNAFNTQSVGGGFLVVGDELWFYFSGRSGRHGTAFTTHQMQTGLATLRRDGFYSMDAPAGEGVLTTRKLTFTGSKLFVNVNAPSGSLQVEALDENGTPIPGFTRAESTPFTGNSTKQAMVWSGRSDVSSLAGRPVRFRFWLARGELYAFWVTPDTNGASFGYVAAGGPGFVSNRDTGDVLPTPPDTIAPNSPTSLRTVVTTTPSVQLSWSAATDNVGVTGYRVYRNGAMTATVSSTSWSDSNVAPGHSYTYALAAVDAAGNASTLCADVAAAIPAIVVPPPAPTPTPSPVNAQYIRIEAEAGSVLTPWQSLYLGPVYLSNGFFIRARTANTGTRTYTVKVPVAGTWKLWGRGSSSSTGGSFHVKMDTGAETLWNTPTWSYNSWTWLPAATFNLTAGTHVLTLRAGISYTYLDVMMLTNDAAFVPSGITGK